MKYHKNMDKKVDDYIVKQPSPQKEICKKLRKIIVSTFPKITEEMRWGVPVYAGGKFYIGAVKRGVNLGLSVKGLTQQEMNLLSGKGRTMRHKKYLTEKDIDEKELIKLVRMVKENSNDC